MYNLAELTGGFFGDPAELTPEKITEYMRRKTGIPGLEIPVGNDAPMFDKDGRPLLKQDGAQLCLPYTHACVFVRAVMEAATKEAGKGAPDSQIAYESAKNSAEISDLPVLFWRTTDVYLVTADGHCIVGQRSNFNKNASGLCLHAAAGFTKAVDGAAESSEASAGRELREETGLSAEKGVTLAFRRFGCDPNNGISDYPIKTNNGILPGRVPTIAEKYSAFTNLTYEEALRRMKSNGESLGFAALPLDKFDAIENGEAIEVPFAPAMATMRRMTCAGRDGSLADIVAPGMRLGDLRKALPDVGRPQDYKGTVGACIAAKDAAVDELTGRLGSIIPVVFSKEDTVYGATSPLAFMRRAAQEWKLLPKPGSETTSRSKTPVNGI